MQTSLSPRIKNFSFAREAQDILRACVHCGFCTATCPTYQLTGDERDGPRGRIYLMKQLLEGKQAGAISLEHLDRCLHCLSCESTCPSGVRYGRLLDISQWLLTREQNHQRPWWQRLKRRFILWSFPFPWRNRILFRMLQLFSYVMPGSVKKRIPPLQIVRTGPMAVHRRQVLMLPGCVQQNLRPGINASCRRVLDRLQVSALEPGGVCCGALHYHLGDHERAKAFARKNIDTWWPYLQQGAEAAVMTASGCGEFICQYGRLLEGDAVYQEKARHIAAHTLDLAVWLREQDLAAAAIDGRGRRIAYQAPCSLQHGQQVRGVVESLLRDCGFQLQCPADAHLCCGAGGAYTLLQPKISASLRQWKQAQLEKTGAEVVVTANIGCQLQLQPDMDRPIMHWIELLAGQLR